jgi:hypothetical protein
VNPASAKVLGYEDEWSAALFKERLIYEQQRRELSVNNRKSDRPVWRANH